MQLLNTLTGQKEDFKPLKNGRTGIFVCGPTVYDWSHIGHARTYIIFDVIAKYLRYKGYKVKFVMNITDLDDKIIDRAKEEKKNWKEMAEFYEKAFMEDIKKLGIDSVDKFARATEHIPQIIKQIQTLIEKGHAYQTDDGVYFDISKFADYGKLAKRTIEQAEDAVSRIDESVNKRNKGDFALWKFCLNKDPQNYVLESDSTLKRKLACWDSPFGSGRPGWHIEDTAISEKYLGQQYDLHCGANELIFPHHEAEIAQQEAASGKKPFVKYWLHSGVLTVNGQKMSKSLKNFITIRDIFKEYSAEALRFMVISTHYRSPIDYKEDLIKQSEAAIQRFQELINKLKLLNPVRGRGALLNRAGGSIQLAASNGVKESGSQEKKRELDGILKNTKLEFETKMDDDFNTPEALAVLFNFIRIINGFIDDNALDKKSAVGVMKFLEEINEIFGILPQGELNIPKEIFELVQKRENLRKQKNWLEADKIRNQIISSGYLIEDTSFGPLVKRR